MSAYHGIVIHGLRNGRELGFPTANIHLHDEVEIENGCYAVRVNVSDKTFSGMLYVGTRPTLNLHEISYEINIFDFHGDIYGMEIAFSIEGKIRDEQHFDNVKTLIEQLKHDKEDALAIIARKTNSN